MSFAALVTEGTRFDGTHFITYFAIPVGHDSDAGREILRCLSDGFEVSLSNDLDEGGEGCTIFRTSSAGLLVMTGGHGWQSKWKPIEPSGVLSAVADLAHLNRGGHPSRQGSMSRPAGAMRRFFFSLFRRVRVRRKLSG